MHLHSAELDFNLQGSSLKCKILKFNVHQEIRASKMWAKTCRLELCLAVLCLIVGIVDVSGDSEPVKVDVDTACADIMNNVAKLAKDGMSECTKELNFTSVKERKERMSCIFKCLMRKTGMLTDQGQIDHVYIDHMVEMVPAHLESLKDKGMAIFRNCQELHEPNLDDAEESCKSYGALTKCLMGMINICKT